MPSQRTINLKYWEDIPADNIIGRNAFPDEELFAVLPDQAHLLDLGCGTGEMSELLSKKGYVMTGIDINLEAIDRNKSRNDKIRYIVGDITKRLPFDNDIFDGVVISFVLVNIIDQAERRNIVSELSRILKPRGVVWVNEGLTSAGYAKRYNLSKPLLKNDRDFFVFKEGTPSSSIMTEQDLRQAIADNKVARIAHHFDHNELEDLFSEYELLYKSERETSSPNTKSVIKMTTDVFRLNTKR